MRKIPLAIYFFHSEKYFFQYADRHEPGIHSVASHKVTQIGQDMPTVQKTFAPLNKLYFSDQIFRKFTLCR